MSEFNGQEQWFQKKDQMASVIQGMDQQHQSDRLSIPRKIHKKWDELRDAFEVDPNFKTSQFRSRGCQSVQQSRKKMDAI